MRAESISPRSGMKVLVPSKFAVFAVWMASVTLFAVPVFSEPAAPAPPTVSPSTPEASGKEADKPRQARTVKGKRFREKETEGTEARNRFQADTVLKSKYEHNGQPLEVDPD